MVVPFGLGDRKAQQSRLEQLANKAIPLFTRDSVQLGEDDQIFFDAQFEIAGHRLRDDSDRAAHAVGLLDDVEAVDDRGP